MLHVLWVSSGVDVDGIVMLRFQLRTRLSVTKWLGLGRPDCFRQFRKYARALDRCCQSHEVGRGEFPLHDDITQHNQKNHGRRADTSFGGLLHQEARHCRHRTGE